MTKIPTRRPKADPLNAPIIDPESPVIPAAGRNVARTDNLDPVTEAVESYKLALKEFNDGRLLPRIEELLSKVSKVQVSNEDESGRAADFQRQLAAAAKAVDEERVRVKAPYLEAGRAIDAEAKNFSTRLDGAIRTVRTMIEDFGREQLRKRRAEEARLEEEARQREAEAAERARAAEQARLDAIEAGKPAPEPEPPVIDEEDYFAPPPPPPSRNFQTRGDYGSVATVATVWKSKVKDYKKAFKAVESNAGVREAIDKAIAARVRSGDREIAGVEIYEDVAARVR